MKKKSKLNFLLIIFIAIILLISASITYLKIKYNDEYIKNTIIQTLTSGSDIKINIKKVESSWFDTSLRISGIDFYPAKTTAKDSLLHIDRLVLNLNFWETLKSKSLAGELTLQNYTVNVQRIMIKNILTGKKEYSTNVSELLNNIIDLPWKKWLSRIDWSRASGEIKFVGGKIVVTDDLGLLADCNINDINIKLSRKKENLNFNLSFNSETPNSGKGQVTIDLLALLDLKNKNSIQQNNFFVERAHLAFIKDIKIEGNINNFDIPYFLKYYGIGSKIFNKLKLELIDPINARFSFNSNTLADVDFKASFSANQLIALYYEKNILPAIPEISLDIAGNFNFLQEWTKFSQLGINLTMKYPDSDISNVNAEVNGDFGDNIVLTLTSETNLSAISNSKLGKFFDLKFYGLLHHTAALNWSNKLPWKINYSLIGNNVSTVVDGNKISSQIKSNLDGVLTHNGRFTLERGIFNFDFSAPFLSLKTVKPIDISFIDFSIPKKTSLNFHADMALFYNCFKKFFKKLKVGQIDEIIAGQIDIADDQKIQWKTELTSKHNQNAVKYNFTGKLNKIQKDTYTVDADFRDEKNKLILNLNSKANKSVKGWEVEFAQSGILEFEEIFKLYERYKILFGGKDLPLKFRGKISEAVNASAIFNNGAISLGVSNRLKIKDFSTVVNKYPIQKKTVNLNSSFSFKLNNDSNLLKINNCSLNTEESMVSFQSGVYDLNIIKSKNWHKILEAFPEISAKVDVGSKIMADIGGAIGNRIADKFLKGATVKGAFTSKGATKSKLSAFKYTSAPLNVQAQDEFIIDPVAMTDIIIAKDFFNIHKSLSDVDALVSADMNNWKGIIPDIATGFIGKFNFNAKYSQQNDKLLVRKFTTSSTPQRQLVIPDLIFSGSLINFFNILQHFTFSKFASSIDKKISIPEVKLSVNQLKFLAGNNPGASIRALHGEYLDFTDLSLIHKLGNPYLAIHGQATGSMSFFSRSSKWPVLAINGRLRNAGNGIVLKINPESIAAKGELDLSETSIKFNALSPYKYNKKMQQKLFLAFYGMLAETGDASIKEASLKGGPLEVSLNNFKHKIIGSRYKLTVEQINIGQPLNTKIRNLLLNSSADIIKAKIDLGILDLNNLQNSLKLNFPINISGIINGGSLDIDDSYWRYFAPASSDIQVSRNPNNRIQLGSTNVTLSSNTSDALISFSIAEGRGNMAERAIVLDNVTVANPKGYSDRSALKAENVSITPELRSLFSDKIIIDTIDVNKMEVFYEMALKKSNIGALEDNLKAVFSSGDNNTVSSNSRETYIKDIYIKDSWVKLSAGLLKGKMALPIPLDIHLQDIGGANAGTTFTSAFGKIFAGIGKVTSGVLGGVGTAVGTTVKGVEKIGKSIIKAPFKLIKSLDGKDEDNNLNETIKESEEVQQ